jgi:hypothetical protein
VKKHSKTFLFLAAIVALAICYTILRIYHPSATEVHPVVSHDLYKYYYEMYHYAAEQLSGGHFPLWNPWQSCGQPFMATHQCGLFYPPNIVYLLMPTHVALGAAFLIHLILSGMFTYLCARRFGISQYGSLLAAITFMFAGHIAYHIGEPSNFYCATWTPLMLYLTKRICDAPSLGTMLSLALFSCVQYMTGFEQHYMYTLYLMLGYVIFHFIKEIGKSSGLANQARLCLFLFLAGILTIGLSAVQLIPTTEMVLLSARPAQPLTDLQIIGLQPVLRVWTGFEASPGNLFLSMVDPSRGLAPYGYAGLLPILALPLIFLNKRQRAHAILFVSVIGFCFVVSMAEWGGWTWVLRIPTIPIFRVIYRIMFIAALCFGLLTGIAWDAIQERLGPADAKQNSPRLLFLLVPLAIGLAALWVMVWRERAESSRSLLVAACFVIPFVMWRVKPARAGLILCQVALAVTLFLDLASATVKPLAFPTATPEIYHRFDRMWNFVSERQGEQRSYFHFSFLDRKHISMGDKYGQLKRVRAISDYEPFVSGKLRDYMVFLQRFPFRDHTIFYGHFSDLYPETARMKLFNIMATRFFIIHRPYARGAFAPGQVEWWSSPPESLRMIYKERDARVYENPAALPRAFVAHDYRVIENPEEMLEEMDAATFDPLTEVLLSEAPRGFEVAANEDTATLETSEEVTFVRDDPEHVEIRVKTRRPGFLVLSDSYYPGWEATVNGESRPIYLANYMFRAVPIDEGESVVSFTYRPASFRWGVWISLISLAACVVVGAYILTSSARQSGGESK